MYANKAGDQIQNGQFSFKAFVSSLDKFEQLFGEILRIIDEIECAEVWHAIRGLALFALLLLVNGFHGAVCPFLA